MPPVVIILPAPGSSGPVPTVDQVNQLSSNLTALTSGVLRFASLIASALGLLLQAIKLLWGNVLAPLLAAVQGILGKLLRIFTKYFPKILDALHRVRKVLMDIYQHYVRPIIVIIQKVRQVLAIFRLLHIHVFDALDKQLAKLESKIMLPFLLVLGRVSSLGNWISYILDLRMLLERNLFLGSSKANMGGLTTLAFDGMINAGPQVATTPSPAPAPPLTSGQAAAEFSQWATTDSGPLTAVTDDIPQLWAQAMSA